MSVDKSHYGHMAAQPQMIHTEAEMADETVRRSVLALIQGQRLRKDEVATATGIPRTTLYRRLAGEWSSSPFTAGEVAALATYFGVEVASIFGGLDGAVRLRVIPGQGRTLKSDTSRNRTRLLRVVA